MYTWHGSESKKECTTSIYILTKKVWTLGILYNMTAAPSSPMSKDGRMMLKNVNLTLFRRHILTYFETTWRHFLTMLNLRSGALLKGSIRLPKWMNFQKGGKLRFCPKTPFFYGFCHNGKGGTPSWSPNSTDFYLSTDKYKRHSRAIC